MGLALDTLVDVLKTAGEPTRFRLLALLAEGDLTVTDLTDILGQSQPRISRHLKLLTEESLIDRYQEGAWAYFRLRQEGKAAALVRTLLAAASEEDPVLLRDSERLLAVKRLRAERAQAYFSRNASEWDELRRLHVSDAAVEAALLKLIGKTPIDALLDLGTGTGWILQLLASVRHGDILNLPLEGQDFDLITIHQVLHFLDQPELAIAEAARVLRPGGRIIIVDLAPHKLDYLREDHAHIRLGFSHQVMAEWLDKVGLEVEEAIDLGSGKEGALTATVWLARDRRLLIASHAPAETQNAS